MAGQTERFLFSTYSAYKLARRLIIGVVGGTITLLGVALLVLPGPAFIVLPLGLAILGVEFLWARRLLRKVRDSLSRNNRNSTSP
ncbi:MAG: PGPGW domain-containing protein [Xanthomonadales bacterium]|nr:PGPGW domain-containing protein [Xanthomonadales bacterium]